ncbi:MAG TPA: hypothetical protein PLI34_14615 [Saprospiraceae bacterium]|nr:hypothetical protein [Saprospiraceae bacterium]HRK81937.1 hypothetical protein [Saprospiraceae bacterium]
MKKTIFLFATLITLTTLSAQQTPQKMSYQAVIRDNSGVLVANSVVGIRISILEGSASGPAVYVETHTVTTNTNGLASLEIGGGIPISGNFSLINWPVHDFYLKTETDPNGGSAYNIVGTSQLLSVPYALYSNIGGLHVKKLHTEDELNLTRTTTTGPNVPGSSTDIGDITQYKGLVLEWRIKDSREVFHQFIYLSQYDKAVILEIIPTPEDYPRRYTTILSDNFGTLMWLGVSIQGTRLYISTNSVASPTTRLQRIFAIL